MSEQRSNMNWPMVVGVASVAALIGFGAAKVMAPKADAPAAPSSSASPAKVQADAGGDEVKVPGDYLQAAGITVEAVASGDVSSEVLAPATVTAAPGGEAVLVAKATGTVERIQKRLGDTVRAGEVLATLASLDAASMAAERSTAQAKLDLARKTFAREQGLFQQGVTPRQEMETAKANLDVAEAEARRAVAIARAAHVSDKGDGVTIVSPIDGKIAAQNVTMGAYVSSNDELFRVTAPGAVQVEASVTSGEAGRIAPGDEATVVLSTGVLVPATVRSVAPTVSGNSRAGTVILAPKGPNAGLVIGEGVQARLHASAGKVPTSLVIPEEAIQNFDGRDVLFIRTEQGFRPQPVLVGTRSGGVAQIISGVKAGDRVATRNAFLIKAEAKKSGGDEE